MNLSIPDISDTFSFTSKQTLQKELKRTRNAYKSLLNNVSVGIIRTDIQTNNIIKINQSALDMFQYESLQSIQKVPLHSLYTSKEDYHKHITTLRRKGYVKNLKLTLQRHNGENLTVLVSSIVHYEEDIACWIDTSVQDITEQNHIQEKMFTLAHFDALTGLSNRYAFMQTLNQTIKNAERYSYQSALLFIDLDGFKEVNDTYGHNSGDLLLIEIAKRFEQHVRKSDTVARMGGDEFTILIPQYSAIHDVAGLAQKIVDAVAVPVELKNATVTVSASIGISLYPHDGKNSDHLLSSADNAMYYAKELGKNNYQFFSKELNIESVNRLIFEMELAHAIERNELYIDFQPRVDTQGDVFALEAMSHWNNPDFGLLNPSDFIPVAEECHHIHELGFWIIQESIYHMKLWQKIKGYEKLSLAINLSCEHLKDPNFLEKFTLLLKDTDYDPRLIAFEIDELALAKNQEHPLLTDLRQLGCHININNFASASTSLALFTQLQPSFIKLDPNITKEVHHDNKAQKIVQASLALATTFDIKLLVHELNEAEPMQWLKDQQCHLFQGTLISKPLAIEEVSNYLIQN